MWDFILGVISTGCAGSVWYTIRKLKLRIAAKNDRLNEIMQERNELVVKNDWYEKYYEGDADVKRALLNKTIEAKRPEIALVNSVGIPLRNDSGVYDRRVFAAPPTNPASSSRAVESTFKGSYIKITDVRHPSNPDYIDHTGRPASYEEISRELKKQKLIAEHNRAALNNSKHLIRYDEGCPFPDCDISEQVHNGYTTSEKLGFISGTE